MANGHDNDPLVPSVFDRLLGEELPNEMMLEHERPALVTRLKASLKRDLENLLNTRCRCGAFPEELTELETSLVNFGIPDFTGANASSVESREAFLQVIRAAIERFEPRLQRVTIKPVDDEKKPVRRVLRFRVEAVLVTEHEQEPVTFVSTMEPVSGSYRVDKD